MGYEVLELHGSVLHCGGIKFLLASILAYLRSAAYLTVLQCSFLCHNILVFKNWSNTELRKMCKITALGSEVTEEGDGGDTPSGDNGGKPSGDNTGQGGGSSSGSESDNVKEY